MTLSLKQLVRRGFTTRQAQALIENTPEAPAAFPEHFANPTGDVAGLTAVLPHIFTNGSYWPTYGGLVTWDGTGPVKVETDDYAWYLRPASTPLTQAGFGAQALESATPGVYVAEYISNEPPTSFPDGWTAGNTTGAGPVLPLLGFPYGSDPDAIFAGLVTVAPGAIVPPRPPGSGIRVWYLCRATTELDALVIADAVDIGWIGPHGEGPDPEPGVYLGVYYTVDGSVPTALPPGWSFQPYGVGAAGPVLAALGEAVKPKVSTASFYRAGAQAHGPVHWVLDSSQGDDIALSESNNTRINLKPGVYLVQAQGHVTGGTATTAVLGFGGQNQIGGDGTYSTSSPDLYAGATFWILAGDNADLMIHIDGEQGANGSETIAQAGVDIVKIA